jgi:hypothetical protein
MNSDQKNEGCVAVVVDKDKWILSSYTWYIKKIILLDKNVNINKFNLNFIYL